jgi:transposase
VVDLNHEVELIASSDAACLRLRQIPGIGPLVATAIVASIGNGAAFHKGREFAAWMGLVPKQYSTGGKAKLYGISKRGNATYARSSSMEHAPWSCAASESGFPWARG